MATTAGYSRSSLYPAVLGPAWHELHAAVQRLHGQKAAVRARGTFAVRTGSLPLTRWLCWIAPLPAAGERVDMQLVIAPLEFRTPAIALGETWRRTFANRAMVSTQREGGPGLVLERVGMFELTLQLTVVAGGLLYKSRRAAMRLFGLRIPLPRWLAPRVTASEKPGIQGHEVEVSIEVSLPWLGFLIGYAGTLAIEGEPE